MDNLPCINCITFPMCLIKYKNSNYDGLQELYSSCDLYRIYYNNLLEEAIMKGKFILYSENKRQIQELFTNEKQTEK